MSADAGRNWLLTSSSRGAAAALREVQLLREVAAAALEQWPAGNDPAGYAWCAEDLAALQRVEALLEAHLRAQQTIDAAARRATRE